MRTNYPFPVLGNEDDLAGHIDMSIHCDLRPQTILLEIQTKVINADIERLLNQEAASVVLEISCSSTFFRETYPISAGNFSISLPASSVRNRVIVESFIVATHEIVDYKPSNPHPDFVGLSYSVDTGDVLALGPIGSFSADKKFDPMTSGASSFLKVGKGIDDQKGGQIELGPQFITVYLPPNDYDKYMLSRHFSTGALHAAMALPTLVYVLEQIKGEHDFEESLWYQRIIEILDEKDIDRDDSYQAAQEILDWPTGRMLTDFATRIVSSSTSEEDEEEEVGH